MAIARYRRCINDPDAHLPSAPMLRTVGLVRNLPLLDLQSRPLQAGYDGLDQFRLGI